MSFLILAAVFNLCGAVSVADDISGATAKPIDLSLPVTPSPKPKRVGLHGGAYDLLKKTKPIDSPSDDATKEGKLKTLSTTGTLPIGPGGQYEPVYNAASPNLPGNPGVLTH